MKYVISDIHGCYREYLALLDKIHFSVDDWLYVLGDAADRGPEPIKVFQDLLNRKNITYILGNHDYMFLYFLGRKGLDLADKYLEDCDPEDITDFRMWLEDGGITTARQFIKLPQKERIAVNEFLEKAKSYEVIKENEKTYILVHAGISNFSEDKPLENYDFIDFIDNRTDYEKRYYSDPNIFVITGHTPTVYIRKDHLPKIYCGNGHIAIDCGCVFGGRLAAYAIETGDATYITSP